MSVRLFCNYVPVTGSVLVPSPESITARQPVLGLTLVGGLHKAQITASRWKTYENTVNPALSLEALAATEGTAADAMIPSPRLDMDLGDEAVFTLIPPRDREAGVDLSSFKIFCGPHAVRLGDALELLESSGTFPQGAVSFLFRPEVPGTYYYKLEAPEGYGVDAYGVIVVYPSYWSLADNGLRKWPFFGWRSAGAHQIPPRATNRNFGSSQPWSYFDSEWVLLFFDSRRLTSTGSREVVTLLNGRSFPDTLLPAQLPPLDDMKACSLPPGYHTRITVFGADPQRGKLPERFLLRVVNAGSSAIPFGLPGSTPMVVTRNGQPGYREGFWTDDELEQAMRDDVRPGPLVLEPHDAVDLLYTARVDSAVLEDYKQFRREDEFSLESDYRAALGALGGPIRSVPQELIPSMAAMLADGSPLRSVRINPLRRFFGLSDLLTSSRDSVPVLRFAGDLRPTEEIAPLNAAAGLPMAVVETIIPASCLEVEETVQALPAGRGFGRRRRLFAGRRRKKPRIELKFPKLRRPLPRRRERTSAPPPACGVANSFIIVHTRGGLLPFRKNCLARVLERELQKIRCRSGRGEAPLKGLYLIFTDSLKINDKEHRPGRRRWWSRSLPEVPGPHVADS